MNCIFLANMLYIEWKRKTLLLSYFYFLVRMLIGVQTKSPHTSWLSVSSSSIVTVLYTVQCIVYTVMGYQDWPYFANFLIIGLADPASAVMDTAAMTM